MSTDIICSIFDGNQVFSFGWQWTPISFTLSGKLIFNYKNNTSMISKYLNKSGKSGVKAYEILPTAIRVQFINRSKWYTYSYASAGIVHIERMKKLALRGFGLNSYIQRCVRTVYEK